MNEGELDWKAVRRGGTDARQTHGSALPVRRVRLRTCVGCRSKAPDTELLRVVVVDGRLVPDIRRRLPGRGAWLHPGSGCLRRAQRRRAFPRALRVPGPLDDADLAVHVEREQ